MHGPLQALCTFFTCEVALRIMAFGSVANFWAEPHNRFEVVLVVLQLVGLIIRNQFLLLLPSIRLYKLMRSATHELNLFARC